METIKINLSACERFKVEPGDVVYPTASHLLDLAPVAGRRCRVVRVWAEPKPGPNGSRIWLELAALENE